jgi:hypothetical protein
VFILWLIVCCNLMLKLLSTSIGMLSFCFRPSVLFFTLLVFLLDDRCFKPIFWLIKNKCFQSFSLYIYINKCMFSVLFNKDLYSMFNGMDMLERLKMKDGDNSWKFPQQKPMGTSSLPSSFCHTFFLSSYLRRLCL